MLTVLAVSYSLAPVSPDCAGGAEAILQLVDAGLVRAHHTSLVVAPAPSRVAGTWIRTPEPPAHLDDTARERAREAQRRAVTLALARYPVDLVHMHGLDFGEAIPPPGVPVLVTLHLPVGFYDPVALARIRPETFFACVSWSQWSQLPDALRHQSFVVPNGIAVESYPYRRKKESFVLVIGRVCPEKGFEHAIDAARKAGYPVVVAGSVHGYPEHVRYFAEVLRPRFGPDVLWVGAVAGERKRWLLSRAACVCIPSRVEETSSLVAMEAFASGTPVVAFRAGALPEVVEHGKTGFIVETVREMAEALGRVAAIDPRACRAVAVKRHDARSMVERYLSLYARIVRRPRPAHAA